MTTQRYIYINSIQFNPTSVEADEDRIGTSRRMSDGSLVYYHRAFKTRWTIQWNNLHESRLTIIHGISTLNSQLTFVDYDNNSHTVLILPGGCKTTVSAEKTSKNAKYYDVTLVLDEV